MKLSFNILHERAVLISKSYLKAESDLIAILQEIDDCKGFRELGYKSLFDYATQSLGLSESVTYTFITIARKSREVPKLQEMIQKQELSVSNARMIAPVLTPENQDRWLSTAAELSKRELEKEIAKAFPERQVQERARYVSEKVIELKMGLSEDLYELFKRVQDLVSSQNGKAANLEETLRAALELYVEKKDPMEKAKRAEKKKTSNAEAVPGQVKSNQADASLNPSPSLSPNAKSNSNLRFIPARLEHTVRLRDEGQCTHKSLQGERCSEKRWLDLHHIQPLSEGGATTFDNLTLLCRGHHQLLHHKTVS